MMNRFAARAAAIVLAGGLLPALATAGIFVDPFNSGLRSYYWTLQESTTGLYSYDGSNGDVRFAKVGTSPGGLQWVQSILDMSHTGGPIAGDFSTEIDVRDIVVAGPSTNQVHFGVGFGSYSFLIVYSNEAGHNNLHVWDGGYRTGFNTDSLAGRMRITRTAGTLGAYFNDQLIWGTTYGGDVSALSFNLMNNHSNDPISVTFDSFSLQGANVVPEPATLVVLALGFGLAAIRRRR